MDSDKRMTRLNGICRGSIFIYGKMRREDKMLLTQYF